MMRIFLLFCAGLVLGSLLIYQIQQGSGYVMVVWGNTTIETSLWFALIVLLVIAILIGFLITVFRGSWWGLSRVHKKISGYSTDKAQSQTVAGLMDFIEGDWSPAHKKLTRAAKKVPAPIINYLAAARCAYEMGDEKNALKLLHEAEKSTNGGDLAIALTQARMQLANNQFEQALATLARASEIKPKHNVVLALQKTTYVALKDWQGLQKLLPVLHQKDIGTVKQRYLLEQQLYRELLKEKIHKNKTLPDTTKLADLEKCWKNIPTHFQHDEDILTLYVKALIEQGENKIAHELLLKGINQQWCDTWVEMYGLLVCSDQQGALKSAESWLKQNPSSAILLLTLGRLCLQNQQWGRAKSFFNDSLSIQPMADTYAELARLQQFLGKEADSQKTQQEGLQHLVTSLVQVQWQ